jgi:outer membrane protein
MIFTVPVCSARDFVFDIFLNHWLTVLIMRTTLMAILIFTLLPMMKGRGQEAAKKDPIESYIREGFESNLVLQQKHVSLQKALLALKTAKSMFLPSVDMQFNYQTADGGRNIPLPLGDLMNGVYATLNQLAGTQDFPQLENETIGFLPKNYYDARIRTTIPIINTDIYYNKKISSQQVILREYEAEIYRRELVKNIKLAYYNYLSALKAVDIYRSSLQLAEEGKRVNEKLLEKGKGLPAYVQRANSEIASAQSQLTAARQQVDNARLYFNSLLNRQADSPVDIAFNIDEEMAEAGISLTGATEVMMREELKSLGQVVSLNETVVRMNKSYRVPKLNGFLDLGSQSEDWNYDGQSRYYMAGLQLNIPVFEGNQIGRASCRERV